MLKLSIALDNAHLAARKLLTDRSGATAIEYGLIAAGISIAILTIVFTLGGDISSVFGKVSTQLQTVK